MAHLFAYVSGSLVLGCLLRSLRPLGTSMPYFCQLLNIVPLFGCHIIHELQEELQQQLSLGLGGASFGTMSLPLP